MAQLSNHYRPDIDGLRAVAVLAVLFYHVGFGFGGYVGVDVFFVISGYLITGLLLKDIDLGRLSVAVFYERRIRRIMPPLVVMVVATLAVGWWLLLAEDYKELGQSVVAQALLVSNVFFWRESGYFEQSSDLRPLLHTWSLGVEEQFYVFFPLVLLVLKKAFRRLLWPVLLLTMAASFALSVWWSRALPEAGFYLLPTRAWELLLGAVLALAPARFAAPRQRGLAEALGVAGLLMILASMFLYDTRTPFPGAAALLPCAGAALVIACGTRSIAGRVLAWPWLVGIGLVSYSLYLWHWPLLVFAKYWSYFPLTVLQRVLLLAASGVLALLSWKWVEQPFRRRVVCPGRTSIYGFAALCTASTLLLGFGVNYLRGMPSRIPPAAQTYADGVQDSTFRKEVSLEQAQRGEFISLGGHQDRPVGVMVWGDSHAMALLPVVDDLCRDKGVQGLAAVHYQTPPLVDYVTQGGYSLKEKTPLFSAVVVEQVRARKVPHVILTAFWKYHFEEGGPDKIRKGLVETTRLLKEAGAQVWVMEDVPSYSYDVPRRLAATAMFGGKVEDLGLPLEAHRAVTALHHKVLQEAASASANYTLLDPVPLLLDSQNRCRVAADGASLYTDGNHVSGHGARLLRPLLAPVFE